jgi:hypothetical protein
MKAKLSTYFYRCEDNMVMENAEICFPPPGDTGQHEKCFVFMDVAAKIAEGIQD